MFVYDSTYQHGMNIVDELIYSEPTQQEQLELALDAVRGHLLPILRLTTPAILVLALSVSGYITICLPTLFETKASETEAQVSETLTYVLGGLLILWPIIVVCLGYIGGVIAKFASNTILQTPMPWQRVGKWAETHLSGLAYCMFRASLFPTITFITALAMTFGPGMLSLGGDFAWVAIAGMVLHFSNLVVLIVSVTKGSMALGVMASEEISGRAALVRARRLLKQGNKARLLKVLDQGWGAAFLMFLFSLFGSATAYATAVELLGMQSDDQMTLLAAAVTTLLNTVPLVVAFAFLSCMWFSICAFATLLLRIKLEALDFDILHKRMLDARGGFQI